MGGASALPRGLYTTPNTHLTPLVHLSPASQPTPSTSSLLHSHKGAFEVRWLKDTIWIVLQNEKRDSVEYSSHSYAEAEPGASSPLTQSRFASGMYLAQSGWLMTPALLMTGSTDVQPVCSSPIVKIRNRIRISSSQRRLCVNWFKVLQQADVHLIASLFFQRIVNEKLIYNTNREDQY